MQHGTFPRLASCHPGGRNLILHRIDAKKKELVIQVEAVIEQVQMVQDYSLSISDEIKTTLDKARSGKANFEECSKNLSNMDDRATITCDMVVKAIIELRGECSEICKALQV